MVVNGAKGIHWYHYQGTTPPENYAAMAKFVTDTTALKEIILGEELKGEVTVTLLNNGRVDYVTKTDGEDIYILAVNIKRANETATFDLGNINAESVEVWDDPNKRTIPVVDGKFSDNFTDLAYHIYKINMADEQPEGVVISGEGVTETPDGRTLSMIAGSETTLSTTLLLMNVEGKNAIWMSTDKEVATVDSSGKVRALKEGTAVIKVMVKVAGKELLSECTLTVTQAQLLGITITTPPVKTVYELNEPLDLTGMVVTGIFEGNYHATLSIAEAIISGFDSSKEQDNQVVTVGYADPVSGEIRTATFVIKVIDKSKYSFIIQNTSIDKTNGIIAKASVSPLGDGREAVVIFKLMRGDTVIGLYSGKQLIDKTTEFEVRFHGYSGNQYEVKIFIWDKLDSALDNVGINLAAPLEVK
jgi:hypothetical protein